MPLETSNFECPQGLTIEPIEIEPEVFNSKCDDCPLRLNGSCAGTPDEPQIT